MVFNLTPVERKLPLSLTLFHRKLQLLVPPQGLLLLLRMMWQQLLLSWFQRAPNLL